MKPMPAPLIRLASTDDVPSLAILSAQLGYPCTEQEMAQRLRAISLLQDHAVFVAQADDAPIAWMHLHISHSLASGTAVEIAGLVVHQSQRGRGIGKALMQTAEHWARSKDASSVRLRSNIVRVEAHDFYAKLGYRVTKTQKAFAKDI